MKIRPGGEAERDWIIEQTCRIRQPVDEHGRPRILWGDWYFAYGHLVEFWRCNGVSAVADVGDDTQLGFALAHGGVVKMVYVKPPFRGHGIGLGLLDAVKTRVPYCATAAWRAWERTWQRAIPQQLGS